MTAGDSAAVRARSADGHLSGCGRPSVYHAKYVSLGTLSEVQAAVASRSHVTATDEAMELYHIGRFIDFPALAHGMITLCSFFTSVQFVYF